MRLKGFKFRIYPTDEQANMIRQATGCRRFIYNWALEQKQTAYQKGQKLSFLDIQAKLPELKKEFPWLKTGSNSQSLQATLRDLDGAFVRFFKKISEYPTFKKKGKSRESFQVPQHFEVNAEEGFMVLPKLGKVKAIFDRHPEGEQRSITVSMSKSGKFFASVLCRQDIEDPEFKPIDPETTKGIDVGLKTFAVVSDGRVFQPPEPMRQSRSKVEFLDRQFSNKEDGSQNKEKARIKLARNHEKLANQRKDFLHKASHEIANENQVSTICIEDLNIQGMMKNHCLARSIGEMGWGEFFRMLEYKCEWRGIRLVKIGRFEPSSKLCPCGYKNDALTLKDREWICIKCGEVHNRDLLAANNIKRFGLLKIIKSNKIETAAGTAVAKPAELPISKLGALKQETHPSLAGG